MGGAPPAALGLMPAMAGGVTTAGAAPGAAAAAAGDAPAEGAAGPAPRGVGFRFDVGIAPDELGTWLAVPPVAVVEGAAAPASGFGAPPRRGNVPLTGAREGTLRMAGVTVPSGARRGPR